MNELQGACTRCREPLVAVGTLVTVESGPLHASHPRLVLCPRCTESFEAWFQRRHRHSSRQGPGRGHSHRHHGALALDLDDHDWSDGGGRGGRPPFMLLGLIFAMLLVGFVIIAMAGIF